MRGSGGSDGSIEPGEKSRISRLSHLFLSRLVVNRLASLPKYSTGLLGSLVSGVSTPMSRMVSGWPFTWTTMVSPSMILMTMSSGCWQAPQVPPSTLQCLYREQVVKGAQGVWPVHFLGGSLRARLATEDEATRNGRYNRRSRFRHAPVPGFVVCADRSVASMPRRYLSVDLEPRTTS